MLLLLQAVFGGAALLMAVLAKVPWLGIGALGVICFSAVLASLMPKFGAWCFCGAVIGIVAIPLSYLCRKGALYTWDNYFAIVAWLVGSVAALAARKSGLRAKRLWKGTGVSWWLLGFLIVCATAYERNEFGSFYTGLAGAVVLLIVAKRFMKLGTAGHQAANTLLILMLGLPIADYFTRPTYLLESSPEPSKRYYSFEGARKDPSAFRRWWPYYVKQWEAMGRRVYTPDPAGVLPFRLKPASEGKMFDSTININSLGFRGREVSREKANAYRIMIVGESTTFGATINKDDKPWPEILEEMIRERLKPSRPVEVINAGVPGYTILHNLSRLSSDIFPLKPDLLLCYHGYNGFALLYERSPRGHPEQPPAYVERPVKLLAKVEHNLKIMAFKRQLAHKPVRKLTGESLSNSPYARAYEELIKAAGTNGARLAIANFSMAVTPDSSSDVIEFYRAAFPAVYWDINANRMHGELVQELVREHSDVIPVDMHPGLDGRHEKFVDLVHMTQEGRQQAAENAFAAIQGTLRRDLK
jgi:hypothetical protein